MSLIILGNRSKNSLGGGSSGGSSFLPIEEQADFTNYFSNPIILPPYSQIALHSAKIVRTAGALSEPLLFVRIQGIPFQSYNGVNSGISTILGTIEDFNLTAGGGDAVSYPDTINASGAIYKASPDRVYLDVNNPTPIHLSQITCQIVKDNEEIITHLQNKTNVILHIRRGRKSKPDVE